MAGSFALFLGDTSFRVPGGLGQGMLRAQDPDAAVQKSDPQKQDAQKSRYPKAKVTKTTKPTETLRLVSTSCKTFFNNVKNKHGALIPNLTKDDFQVFEDGKPQTIKYFAAEWNCPTDSRHSHRF